MLHIVDGNARKNTVKIKKDVHAYCFQSLSYPIFFVVMESIMDFVLVLAWLTKQPKEIVYIQNTLNHFKAHVL